MHGDDERLAFGVWKLPVGHVQWLGPVTHLLSQCALKLEWQLVFDVLHQLLDRALV
ncbi:hypothetical protein D3C81_2090620 [compost metagenome]